MDVRWEETVEEVDWRGGFVPPPPRPLFLDSQVHSDGLTTCDLCTWATRPHHEPSIDQTGGDNLASLPWSITLVVVSIVSAVLGATVMVTLRRCFKRLNTDRVAGGVGRRRGAEKAETEAEGAQAGSPSIRPSHTNHYTIPEPTPYTTGSGEGVYAELDRPMYQNTTGLYLGGCETTSSAYYSDLSERTYETVHNNEMACLNHPPSSPSPPPSHHRSDYV